MATEVMCSHAWFDKKWDERHLKSDLDVVKYRYAKGDISREEYLQILADVFGIKKL